LKLKHNNINKLYKIMSYYNLFIILFQTKNIGKILSRSHKRLPQSLIIPMVVLVASRAREVEAARQRVRLIVWHPAGEIFPDTPDCLLLQQTLISLILQATS
jgi:hypothetical protein